MRRVTGSLLVLSFVITLGLLALASPSMILRAEDSKASNTPEPANSANIAIGNPTLTDSEQVSYGNSAAKGNDGYQLAGPRTIAA